MRRKGSPAIGSSLITRAPKSASIEAPKGEAMMAAASTTVTPVSGKDRVAMLVSLVSLDPGVNLLGNARSAKVKSTGGGATVPGVR